MKYILIFSLLFYFSETIAQNRFPFLTNFGDRANPFDVVEMPNKNYLCVIGGAYNNATQNMVKLIVLSPTGSLLDSLIFRSENKNYEILSIVPMSYGYCLLGGMKQDTTTFLWVINLNPQIKILNEQFYPILQKSFREAVYTFDRDSNIVLCVSSRQDSQTDAYGRIDKKGRIKFCTNRLTTDNNRVYCLPRAIVISDSLHYKLIMQDRQCICDTAFQNRISTEYTMQNFLDTSFISTPKIHIKNDSTYLLAGNIDRGSWVTNMFFSVVKNGAYVYHKITAFGGDTSYYKAVVKSIDTTADGRFIYIGGTHNMQNSLFNIGRSYLRIVKMDQNYNTIWTKDLGDNASHLVLGILATSDGGCLIYACRYDFNDTYKVNAVYIKVDGNGIVTSTTSIPVSQSSIIAYPNPSNGQLRFKKEDPSVLRAYELNIFDMSGKLVYRKQVTDLSETYDLNHLATGDYMYQIKQKEQIISIGKWVKIE